MAQRKVWLARLREGKVQDYCALHAKPWPEILRLLSSVHISDYTIWLHESERLLVSSFVYSGADFDADMAVFSDQRIAQDWLAQTSACQESMSDDGGPWATLIPVFRLD